MSIEIKNTEIVLKKILDVVNPQRLGKLIYKAAADFRNVIVRRAAKGQGYEGEFDAYSTKEYYRPIKERPIGKGGRRISKTGRKLKTIVYEEGYAQFAALTKGSSIPNLSATNNMLRAMQAQAVNNFKSRIGFTTQAAAYKAFYNQKNRPFFGSTPLEEINIRNWFQRQIEKIVVQEGLS